MNYSRRRAHLLSQLQHPLLLFSGGEVARNTPSHTYPFRADSNFLYFFGPCEPGCAALFEPDTPRVSFFAPARTFEASLWTGPRPSFEALKEALAIDEVLEVEHLEAHLQRLLGGRPLHSLAVADAQATARAQKLTGQALCFGTPGALGEAALLKTLARMRLCKDADEVAEMSRAADITREALLLAMRHTRPGRCAQDIYAQVLSTFTRHACTEAYASIVSVRGEVLHNPVRAGLLQAGDLLLVDAGAERPSGYGADITRTWPVSGRFSPEAKALYEVVLAANQACIAAVRPGVHFRSLQRIASEILAQGLVELGLMKGPVEEALAAGALSIFFPHGIGHPLGLDTHDLGAFGNIGALLAEPKEAPGQPALRMDVALEAGMTVTVEPGIYFVPQRIYSAELRKAFGAFVDFEEAERYVRMNEGRGFGGIRIEDNVLCRQGQAQVLTEGVPKEVEALEAAVG